MDIRLFDYLSGGVHQKYERYLPWITVSLCLPAVTQLYVIFSWLTVGHQVVITEITVVVSTHTTYL